MNRIASLAERAGLITRSTPPVAPSGGVLPPPREKSPLTSAEALHLGNVYAAISLHATAAAQLPLTAEKNGLRQEVTPSLLREPDRRYPAEDFITAAVIDLATTGNAFWKITHGADGPLEVRALNPHHVAIVETKAGDIRYLHDSKTYTPRDIQHVSMMRRTGQLAGLGPIQAARVELSGARDLRDYADAWFHESGVPSGVLKTSAKLSTEKAEEFKRQWNKEPAGTTRVLSDGLDYQPIMLKPEDAQFVEQRKLTVIEIARLFGIPAQLFVMALEGGSMSYSNLEQDLTVYSRFGLMRYLKPIEAGFTRLLPHGTKARFNLEGLMRTDTKSRYEAHKIAIDTKLYSPSYARRIEGIPNDARPTD